MDQLSMAKTRLFQTISIFMWILCLVAIATFVLLWKAGRVADNADMKTISLEGKAERFVAPDIATLSFGVSEEAKTVREAQTKATEKINKAIAFLKEQKVDDKDVKTTSYNVQPKYEYYYANEKGTRCYTNYCPPPYYQKSEIVGYTVEQQVNVKVRDLDVAGDVIAGLGSFGVGNVSGLSFEVEDIEKIREEVKNEAIADARAKAKTRAKALDVSLGKLVSVSDNNWGGGYYERVETAKVMMMADNVGGIAAAAPEIPAGENQIIATVNLTYEID